MSLITVDQESCIKCGLCVEECPTRVLKLESTGPIEINGNSCIACGHCVAVCPKEAIDNEKSPLALQSKVGELPKLDPEQVKNFMRSRRSIRSYKTNSVEREKLLQLVEVANLAPTGSNTQGISYLIIDDKKTIEAIVEECIIWFENHPVFSKLLGGLTKGYREYNADGILRNAPSLIIALADKDLRNARENSIFQLTYLELFAPTIGLGSCWAGILEVCARNEDSPIHKLLNISDKKIITGCVMVGYPKHSFKRFPERRPLSVSFYNE